jgi:hypothetical protein
MQWPHGVPEDRRVSWNGGVLFLSVVLFVVCGGLCKVGRAVGPGAVQPGAGHEGTGPALHRFGRPALPRRPARLLHQDRGGTFYPPLG